MRGGKKLFGLVAIFFASLVVLGILSLGLAEVPRFSFFSEPISVSEAESSSIPTVFVDPANTIDETLQAGSYFTVHVNISDVIDLFAWQINISWDPSILNVSRSFAGEFLLRTSSESKTAAYRLGFVMNKTDNAVGYIAMGESILGGVPGINGSGRLVSIEFLVTGYGSTELTISLAGNLPTTLLNSTVLPDGQPATIPFTKIDGYFSNKIPGDIDGDKDVDPDDFAIFAGAYGSKEGDPTYDPEADLDRDGDVDPDDFAIFAGNYGRSL